MTPLDITVARDALAALRQLELELAEAQQQRRRSALERVRGAILRIGEIGAPDGMLERAAEELGTSSAFDRVLISRLEDKTLYPQALWTAPELEPVDDVSRLQDLSIRLAYPLIEAEVVQHGDAQIVEVAAVGRRSPAVLRERFGWTRYAVAALTLNGRTIGLLHADSTYGSEQLDEVDCDIAALYAEALARCYELAVLRHTLEEHRNEQWAVARWMSERLQQAETLKPAGDDAFGERQSDALTPRERDVVGLLGKGMTNAAIARALTVSEGTVKYHVANLLRKLGATSRADAVARHLRSGAS